MCIRDSSTLAGAVPFTVTDTTDNMVVIRPAPTVVITFTAGTVDGGQSTVTAAPAAVAANGTAASTVTVTMMDHFQNPVAGKTVQLTQGPGHAVISPATAQTASDGTATFAVTDTTNELVTFSAIDVDDQNLLVFQ